MADTAVAITAGTGTNIDTRTEATNGNHRQVIVIGDPSTNASVAAVMAASTAPAATDPALVVAMSPNTQNANGQATMANSTPVVMASDFVGTSGFMKKEDVASADGDAGVGMLAVRKATPANTSGTDGDYEFLQMSAGRLWASATIDAAIPAGTNAIGKLAANSGVDIGDVDVTSISAGENHLGEVGGKTAVFAVALSTDTSAYASGDLIADTQQMDAFFRKTDGTGVINSITIIDQDAQGVALYVLFMSTSTSLGTENSAPNISDANLATGLQGIVAVATTDYVTVSGAKVATIRNIGLPVKAVSGTDDLYIAVLNATGTPTFTATGLNMKIQALLD